jgi:hypothetical protein
MNRREAGRVLASIPLAMAAGLVLPRGAEARQQPAGQFPRLQAAIAAIEDAVDFLQKAPDDFGGHKAAAIQACNVAVRQLRAAMAYRRAGGR